MSMRLAFITAAAALLSSGCTRDSVVSPEPERQPTPVALRIQLAHDAQQTGYAPMTTQDGESVFVNSRVEFDNRDVLTARALHGDQRTLLQIVLNRLAAERMRRVTRAHLGERMAIFLDDGLVSAPRIQTEVTGGEIRVIGRFSSERVEELAAGLTAHE